MNENEKNNKEPEVNNPEINNGSGNKQEEILNQCQKEKEEYLNGWKRAKADFINYQKDEIKRMADIIKFSNENLIKELLPVLDSFDLALIAINDKKFEKGVEMIYSQMENTLRKQGLELIKSLGIKFDPAIHEAIEELESDQEDGTIIEEFVKGWKLNGKVIRPSKVKISKKIKN
ncbi:MAG: molecular chaperone GrpE [Parcubacteria group bacterium Athens1014_26]|nr:MAG: molecular chaperone GrpE [Parcubacteria group bacterium Athens1014_26]